MTLNFPTNPDIGDIFPEGAVKQWQWNGVTWNLLTITETQVERAETAAVTATDKAEEASMHAANAANVALSTPLTGLDTSTAGDVTATDNSLTAFGKIQARISAILNSIGLLAPKESPVFTGTPVVPTPNTLDDSTQIANTAFVKAQGYLTSVPVTSVAGKNGAVTLDKNDVGLNNVDNTSDIDKPVSTQQAQAIAVATSQYTVINETTSFTLGSSHLGSLVLVDSTTPVTITVPLESVEAFNAGSKFFLVQMGEGALTIEGDVGVIVNVAVGLTTTNQFAKLELIKTGSDEWLLTSSAG